MDRERVVNFTGTIIIFFVLLFVYSKWGPSFPISVLTQSKGEPMVVSGVGKVTVVPDIAKISIGLEEQGSNLKQVQQTADLKAKNLKDQILKLGVKENEIKTTQYNVYPTYDYSERTQRLTGYRVSTSYEVKVTNFEVVNDVITAATSAGANNIGGISLEVNDETKKDKLQEAREIAVKEAKQKAEGLARASGMTLGRIINVTEDSVDGGYPRPYMSLEKSAVGMGNAADAVASPANVVPGESELQVNVSLSYEVR